MGDVVRCENLSSGYHGVTVLHDISFRLRQGESMLLIGHNGAGKSTLLRTLFGLLAGLGGHAEVCGMPTDRVKPAALIRHGARYLGQGSRAFDALSIADQRGVLRRLYGLAPGKTSATAGPSRLERPVGALSGGQKRLEALRLLDAGDPQLFVLDEPLAGVDPRNADAILGWIAERREAGASFLIAEHRFSDLLTTLDSTLVLRRGSVSFYGRSNELQETGRLAQVYL